MPFYKKKVAAKTFAKSKKLSLEDSARILRYQAFEEFLTKSRFSKLATAHTANDQAETILLHLIKGAGSAGLAGMPLVKRFAQGWHLRPLLGFPRAALQAYATQHQLAFVEDQSNLDRRYERNYLRHQIILVTRGDRIHLAQLP